MKTIFPMLQRIAMDESGQDLIEYALIAAVVGLAATATLKTVADAVNGIFTAIAGKLTAATPAS